MYDVTYVVKNRYDSWLCERRNMCFTGAIFESLEEIAKWEEKTLSNGKGYITKIVDLTTNTKIER